MYKLLIIFILLLTACTPSFDTHPYDVDYKGEKDINAHHIAEIERLCAQKDTLRIAVMSDTHGWYSDTRDIINDINHQPAIDFAIHGGDLTDTGTHKAFEWVRDLLGKLNKPYVAIIGNHDFLGTGDQSYTTIFGRTDFCFIANRIKFVCLNTNATEYDYLAAVPNFDFMETAVTADSASFDRTIVVMHARPYSDQFNNNVAKAFQRYLHLFPGIMFCISAHDHSIQADNLYGDGLMFYGIDCAEHRNYHIFTITKEGYSYEVVHV